MVGIQNQNEKMKKHAFSFVQQDTKNKKYHHTIPECARIETKTKTKTNYLHTIMNNN